MIIRPAWANSGWLPFKIVKHWSVDDFIVILGEINDGHYWKKLDRIIIRRVGDLKFENPVFYKEEENEGIRLSTFGANWAELTVHGWKRSRITEICPGAIQYLRIKVGDSLIAEFQGTYMGMHLVLRVKNCMPEKVCVIDKSNLSAERQILLAKYPYSNFDLQCVVDRITPDYIFLREKVT